jgi:hypothetical protein
MKQSNRQLVIGSLQPFLFCVGMYCVVLIFSVFVCTSIFRAMNPQKYPTIAGKSGQQLKTADPATMVASIK